MRVQYRHTRPPHERILKLRIKLNTERHRIRTPSSKLCNFAHALIYTTLRMYSVKLEPVSLIIENVFAVKHHVVRMRQNNTWLVNKSYLMKVSLRDVYFLCQTRYNLTEVWFLSHFLWNSYWWFLVPPWNQLIEY